MLKSRASADGSAKARQASARTRMRAMVCFEVLDLMAATNGEEGKACEEQRAAARLGDDGDCSRRGKCARVEAQITGERVGDNDLIECATHLPRIEVEDLERVAERRRE